MKTTSDIELALEDGSMTAAEALEGLRAIRAALVEEMGEEWVREAMMDALALSDIPVMASATEAYRLCDGMAAVVES